MLDIEIHQTKAEGRRVYVDYTIGEQDKSEWLKMFNLIEFVKTEEMNIGEFITSDKDIDNYYLDPATFLFENLSSVVKAYLEHKLEVSI